MVEQVLHNRAPAPGDTYFHFRGRKHRLGPDGTQIVKLLNAASANWDSPEAKPGRLLPFYGDFLWVIHRQPMRLLGRIVESNPSASIRRLAIWLLGRCRSTVATASVAAWGADPDPKLRREVVRALQRMHAWSELRKIASTEHNPAILRMALQRPPASYRKRLHDFLGNVTRRQVSDGRQPLIITEHCDLAAGRPPKPRWMIRYLLERIQYWVRGSRA